MPQFTHCEMELTCALTFVQRELSEILFHKHP